MNVYSRRCNATCFSSHLRTEVGAVCLDGLVWQLSGFVVIGKPTTSSAGETIISLLRMQFPTSSSGDASGVCVVEGLTATSRVLMEVLLQLSIGAVMACMVGCAAVGLPLLARVRARHVRVRGSVRGGTTSRTDVSSSSQLGSSSVQRSRVSGLSEAADGAASTVDTSGDVAADSSGVHASASTLAGVVVAGDRQEASSAPWPSQLNGVHSTDTAQCTSGRGALSAGDRDGSSGCDAENTDDKSHGRHVATVPISSSRSRESGPHQGRDDFSISSRGVLVSVAVNFLLTVYTTLTVACVRLLNCVHVPGTPSSETRLFLRGTVTCDLSGWQLPYAMILAALSALPLVTGRVTAWALSCRSEWASESGALTTPATAVGSCSSSGGGGDVDTGSDSVKLQTNPLFIQRRAGAGEGVGVEGSSADASRDGVAPHTVGRVGATWLQRVCGSATTAVRVRMCGHARRVWPGLHRDVKAGVFLAMIAPYRDSVHWWESVLLAQRLVVALVFAFGSTQVSVLDVCIVGGRWRR